MSIYDSVYLGPNIRIDPEFGYESVTLLIHYRRAGHEEWELAWDPNGSRALPTIPLRYWEEIQRAVIDDLGDVLPPNATYGDPTVLG